MTAQQKEEEEGSYTTSDFHQVNDENDAPTLPPSLPPYPIGVAAVSHKIINSNECVCV